MSYSYTYTYGSFQYSNIIKPVITPTKEPSIKPIHNIKYDGSSKETVILSAFCLFPIVTFISYMISRMCRKKKEKQVDYTFGISYDQITNI